MDGPKPWTDCIANETQPANLKCLESLFSNIVAALIGAAGLALFIMLVIGGYKYLMAGGDAQAAESARSTMFWAVMGIVFMILSFIILRAIEWFTGVPVTIFQIPFFEP
ncbi:hypothetical protein HY469_04840 [Candidatus Roizmanbacteria bacterium]|nr:hypothetical protein [Candidatus Roizmanbacteria bacterium]